MELPQSVFGWLTRLNVMQEAFAASRNAGGTKNGRKVPATVTLTAQATNAMLSGHAFYYVCYNIAFSQGTPFTSSSLVGSPGDECAAQAALYNWQILSDIFGSLGFQLSQDHRSLIVGGDTKVLAELMRDLYIKFSGDVSADVQQRRWANATTTSASGGATAAAMNSTLAFGATQALGSTMFSKPGGSNPSPKTSAILVPVAPRRDGAMSVDSGLAAIKERKKQTAQRKHDVGIEQSRQKFLAKLEKERAEQEQKEEALRRAEDLRMRMTENIDYARFKTDTSSESHSKYPVFLEFQNRGAVNFCLKLVEEIVDAVETGAAQEALAAKEQAREAARRAARERKRRGNRLVDVASPVHLPPTVNHKIGLMISSIVMNDIVGLALQDDVREILEQRAEARKKERGAIGSMLTRLDQQMAKSSKEPRLKYAERLKQEEEEAARAQAAHEKKVALLRDLNREAAKVAEQKAAMIREEKLAKEAAEKQAELRKQAEHTLYVAEQRAKVIERRRERELKKTMEAEAARQREELERAERRRVGMELNKKLQEKEQARLRALGAGKGGDATQGGGSGSPMTLSAFNTGSGDHAAYYGDTLGWQYLTETEFDVAQMICQARTDPPSMIPCLEQQLNDLHGKTIYYTDENSRRHPCVFGEGRPALLAGIEFLGRCKSLRAIDDVSIGLTLAARQHAIDLVYHGIAEPTHTGSDGSTLSQRVLRYGSPAMRHGCVELVSCVVRPSTLRLGPVDVVTRYIVADGDPARQSREALYNLEMCESAGFGHALAEMDGLVVEAVVVILSFGFLDKPVAQMAAAHHHGVRAVAAPFLDGLRRVHESVADRRRLMRSSNLVIGRLTDAKPNVDYLSSEKLRRRKHMPPPDATSAAGYSSPVTSGQDGSMSPFYDDEDDDGGGENDEAGNVAAKSPPKKQRTAAEETLYQQRRARLLRFYAHYAPAKSRIVDDALNTFDGRFDELIEMLVNKYGPEPPEAAPAAATASETTASAEDASKKDKTESSTAPPPQEKKEPSASPSSSTAPKEEAKAEPLAASSSTAVPPPASAAADPATEDDRSRSASPSGAAAAGGGNATSAGSASNAAASMRRSGTNSNNNTASMNASRSGASGSPLNASRSNVRSTNSSKR